MAAVDLREGVKGLKAGLAAVGASALAVASSLGASLLVVFAAPPMKARVAALGALGFTSFHSASVSPAGF